MVLCALLIFFAAVSLGFRSPHQSQMNIEMWFNMLYLANNTELFQRNSLSEKIVFDEPALENIQLLSTTQQFHFPTDSTEQIVPIVDSTLGGIDAILNLDTSLVGIDSTLNVDSTFAGIDSTLSVDSILAGIDSTLSIDSILAGIDSTLSIDSTLAADTIKVDWREIDSTNRIEYFHYTREDQPYVQLKEKKQSKFFVDPSPAFRQRTINLDSTGQYVEIKEKIAGYDSKLLLRMSLEDYIYLKLAERDRKNWEGVGYKYDLRSTTTGLGELITSLTDFEIPLPKVGVLSIFGEPKISLKIGGAVQIHGAWRNETTEGVTASRLGNTRNEPDFKQQVQINVSGTIGDKLNISADWNTERTFQYENQLKIKYTGYDDEIIQSIEAGNVSMQTAPLIGGAEALFGIKAQFQLGPFRLTTIASQKKGETKEVSVSGGSTSQEYQVRAYDYSENHYFIHSDYSDSSLFKNYFFEIPPRVDDNLRVNEIEVWKSINVITPDKSKERFANAYIGLQPLQFGQTKYPDSLRKTIDNPVAGQEETGRFQLLTRGIDYILHPQTGFISFKTSVQQQDVIAVSFKQGPIDLTYGEFIASSQDTFLVLKLVKPRNLQPRFTQAWRLLLKNIYPTGSRNIKKEGFDFRIKYEVVGQDPTDELQTQTGSVKLLNAFGLDQQGEGGNPNPDDNFDWRPGFTIFPETGEIIFPMLQPLGRNIPPALNDLKYQLVYDTTKTFARQDKINDKWVMTGKQTGDVSAVYQLGFNMVENSVRVLLDGRELSSGVDYIVDYTIGQLTIRNEAALVPGADLKITYEQNDLFQLASKTLLGARGIYDFSDKTTLGFTIMNLNQQTLSDKVRIGEEPLSNTIMGMDFKTSGDLPFLTKLLDNVISTREMSNFTFTGEYAYMSPDPNTKKSTVASDGGKSIAYIDDFEGAKKTIPIGIGYTGWKDLSPPDQIPGLEELNLDRRQRMNYKAKSFWYNITPALVTVQQIYGDQKQVARADQQVTVLDFVYLPDSIGTFNWDPADSITSTQRWGGTQKLLSSTANNLVEQNIEFVEFWMHIDEAPADAKLYLDMGLISEDVIPDGMLNSEDKNFNDAIDEGEDTGLDTLFDAQERFNYPDARDELDPSGDNFVLVQGQELNPLNYYKINGTEGNAVLTDVGRLPDTEDLNRTGTLDVVNSYFRYEIPVNTDSSTNPFISGGGFTESNWFLYRVPLKDTLLNFGNASLSNVETLRLFVTGISEPLHIQITEFNLVGSQWQKPDPQDTVLSISVVSQEENLDYTSPPGVFRERDRTRPDEEIFKNEQSLNLILKDLEDGQSREAIKYLFRPLDVFNYSEMKLFIHGDDNNFPGSISYNDPATGEYSAEVFFRFGTDTNNYYEYRQPVTEGWNEISIIFDEITAIKQAGRDSIDQIIKIPVQDQPGHFFLIKGNPTLISVKFLTVGIVNLENGFNPGPLSGEIWVNELRVIGAEDTPGWAYNVSGSVKFADLMTVNANLSEKNPYFHKLSERFGSRVESRNWAVSTNINVLKLLPFNLPKSNLKINYSHTESLGKPLYIPGTDVLVEEAVKQLDTQQDTTDNRGPQTPEELRAETQTLSVSNTFSASSIKLAIPTDVWYIRDSFNALTFGFSYNNSFRRSPTIQESKNWLWNASMNYGISFSPDLYINLADIPVLGWVINLFKDYRNAKVYFTPQNISAAITAKRNRNSSITRVTGNIPANVVVSRDFSATRGFNFVWRLTEGGFLNITTTYNVSVNSSLAYLLVDENDNERTEGDMWSDIFGGEGFGKDYGYQQTFDLRLSPKLPSLWDINRYFTITGGYSVNYSWNYDLRQTELGRSAGFSAKTNIGLVLRWKSLTAPLFSDPEKKEKPITTNRTRGRDKGLGGLEEIKLKTVVPTDTTGTDLDSVIVKTDSKPPVLSRVLNLLKLTAKAVFFDWDNFSFNFSNSNSLSKSGLKSTGTGFGNFWGFSYNQVSGPSRSFMLGLSQDAGERAGVPNTNLSDVFSDKNNFDFKTSRPLWEGAKIDVTWKVGWGMNKNTTLATDENGNLFISNITSSGNLNRSFLSLPLPFFDSGIKKVHELYNPNADDPRKSLSNAFVEGLETFGWARTSGFLADVAKYVPRANWRITWDGLEKFPLFKIFTKRVALEHSYSSNYTEGWRLTREGKEEIQTQKIDYGFTPLVGLNMTFGQLWEGNLSGNIKYSTRSSFDLGITTTNITETFSKDIGFTASYSKSGFELPLFGVSLKNDIEFTFAYTLTQNSIVRFEMDNFNEEGIPQDGTTRTTIEPRIRYTISSKVTLSIFYKRSTVEPKGAARIPPTTTNEAGLDINIVIQ
jgi:cell surface protein SprA